jgi:hypothetical protein
MKITVAIPTIAGRSGYLEACLKTCVSQEYEDLEILVSDNSYGEAAATVHAFRDPRIRYIRPERYLPMSQHWDFMIPHMTGDLVTIIGDDDGVMPNGLNNVATIISEYGLMPLQHSIAHYCWPDVPDSRLRNTYWFHQRPGTKCCIRKSADYLREICACRARYIDGPMIYHNFVPRDLLARMLRGGSLFHRSIPDIYTAVSVSMNTTEFIATEQVLTVSGEGAKSNGAQAKEGGAEADRFLKDMKAVGEQPHCRFHAVALGLLDAIVEASIRYDRPDVRDAIATAAFYAEAINECRGVRNAALRRQRLLGIAVDSAKLGILPSVLAALVGRVVARVRRTRNRSSRRAVRYESLGAPRQLGADVGDVHTAALQLDRILADR